MFFEQRRPTWKFMKHSIIGYYRKTDKNIRQCLVSMILPTNTTEAQFATWLIAIMCRHYGSSKFIWIVIPHHLTDPSTLSYRIGGSAWIILYECWWIYEMIACILSCIRTAKPKSLFRIVTWRFRSLTKRFIKMGPTASCSDKLRTWNRCMIFNYSVNIDKKWNYIK